MTTVSELAAEYGFQPYELLDYLGITPYSAHTELSDGEVAEYRTILEAGK